MSKLRIGLVGAFFPNFDAVKLGVYDKSKEELHALAHQPFDHSGTVLGEGFHAVRAEATDLAGNTGSRAFFEVPYNIRMESGW